MQTPKFLKNPSLCRSIELISADFALDEANAIDALEEARKALKAKEKELEKIESMRLEALLNLAPFWKEIRFSHFLRDKVVSSISEIDSSALFIEAGEGEYEEYLYYFSDDRALAVEVLSRCKDLLN